MTEQAAKKRAMILQLRGFLVAREAWGASNSFWLNNRLKIDSSYILLDGVFSCD
jgi:hypothetical protein